MAADPLAGLGPLVAPADLLEFADLAGTDRVGLVAFVPLGLISVANALGMLGVPVPRPPLPMPATP